MLEFLHDYQLNIMLALSSACGTIVIFVLFTKALSESRRRALLLIELSSMFLLYFDRLAYIYSGNESHLGYVMVRVTNFLVFSLTLIVSLSLNLYITDLFKSDGGMKKEPFRLKLVNILCVIGIVLIVISQFTNLYYYFDETNKYHRSSPGFLICYIFPVLVSLIQLTVIIQYRKYFKSRLISLSLILFIVIPLIASAVQIKAYGLSLTNMSIVGVAIYAYIASLLDLNDKVERANKLEVSFLQEERRSMQRLFDQTADSFVNAIDLKDVYTKGHSERVANYAREIADLSGKDEKECAEVYYAGLLHDVGKISIPDKILQNDGRLSEEEYEIWKTRSEIGDQILSGIKEYPYLRDGAHYVHERYDGSGYPKGLKGEEIPEIARIVAVADYYDSLTSKKSYRDAYPQPFVREVFVKGSGTLFDPKYAEIMVSLIDSDTGYSMREEKDESAGIPETELLFEEYRNKISRGILVERTYTKIRFSCETNPESKSGFSGPSLIVFDSYDGRVHDNERTIEAFCYLEYAEVWFDGHTICTRAKNIKSEFTKKTDLHSAGNVKEYEITVGKNEDHMRITIDSEEEKTEVIVALPDNSKYAYVALTGEYCEVREIEVKNTEEEVKEGDIPRIASKDNYINRMEGNLPNLQIDRNRYKATRGITIMDGLRITFHTKSLPSANFVWHCPYIVIFTSKDRTVYGEEYKEYALIKCNGECETPDRTVQNTMKVIPSDTFTNWEDWKEANKRGLDCTVRFEKGKNYIFVTAEIGDVTIENKTTMDEVPDEIYAAITGDRCAITTIRIK